jgi:tetratricopeptide (TPR) repeat protein
MVGSLFLSLSLVFLTQQIASPDSLDDAAHAFQQGDSASAEQKLRAVLKSDPGNLRALVLMGAVLDSQRKFGEAETCYQSALRIAPHSAQVLNNAGNHYLDSGKQNLASQYYLKTIAVDPHHINANLQLAQMNVAEKQGHAALSYLEHLPDSENTNPLAQLLRAQALSLVDKCTDASRLLEKLENGTAVDPKLHFSAGIVLGRCKLYDGAENAFTRALETDPTNFEGLYNLGLAALESGHTDRAISALETALREKPADVDSLYALSQAYIKREQLVDAATLLTQAQKLAPGRADVQLELAQVSFHLGFYEDAAATYNRYLELRPADDVARRERGMAWACANQPAKAFADLEWYVHKHGDDATGFYELGMAQYFTDHGKALQSLNRALTLDPSMIPARYTRAVLNIEDQKPQPALDDLSIVLEREPSNARVLARVGQTYLALGRPLDAENALTKSLDLEPDQPLALMYQRSALERLGRKEAAALVLARLKQADSLLQSRRPQSGLIDYLSLSPASQRARYLANLRRNMDANPTDPRWKVRLGTELLSDGKIDEAEELLCSLKTAGSSPELLASSGHILVQFERYQAARTLLEPAISAEPSLNAARLDLAISLFHTQSPDAALTELDKMPPAGRNGDYYLLRAQILDSQGKMQEAADALNRGIKAAPTMPSLYLSATGFLLKHHLDNQALVLLQQASRTLPEDRELLLAHAAILATIPRDEEALAILTNLQTRWPEWEKPYLLNGIILEIQLKSAEARGMLETAIALGANTPEAYYYEALAVTHTAPDNLEDAEHAIAKALDLTSKDPYIFLLAGKIALQRKDLAAAVQRLRQATALMPTLIPAHYALRDAYRAVGAEDLAASELEAIHHIAAENATADKSPFPAEEFLFMVRSPG